MELYTGSGNGFSFKEKMVFYVECVFMHCNI